MGRPNLTDAEASAISKEAAALHKAMTADEVARELGVTWAQRQALRLTTIGAVNMPKEARKEIRRIRDKVAKEKKRRAAGVQPRAKYEAYSLSATKPWRAENKSRRTWERHRDASVSAALLASTVGTKINDASASAAYLLIAEDGLASARPTDTSFLSDIAGSDSPVAADIHVSMSPEARYLALGIRPQRVVQKNPWHREREEDLATIERFRRTANGGAR
jgi:hypothetical protein